MTIGFGRAEWVRWSDTRSTSCVETATGAGRLGDSKNLTSVPFVCPPHGQVVPEMLN